MVSSKRMTTVCQPNVTLSAQHPLQLFTHLLGHITLINYWWWVSAALSVPL